MSFFSQTTYSKIETSFYEPIYGNYKFDTDLTGFGIIRERKIRKVNRSGSILKLKEVSDTNSIYPMLDEFGYTFADFFIFKSTWDLNYHLETTEIGVTQFRIPQSKDLYTVEKSLIDLGQESITIGRNSVSTNNQFE